MPDCPYRPRKYLSISTLLDYMRCPRKYFYAKCGLSSLEEPLAPQYGLAMHKAIPTALALEDLDAAMKDFLSVWEETEDKISESFDGVEDPKRNRKTARRTLQHFIHTHKSSKSLYKLYQPEWTGMIQTDKKTSDFEVPWVIDIGLDIPLVGRFDGACRHRDTDEEWLWELKTTSRLNSNFFEAHEMYPQTLTYSLVAKTLFGVDIKGVMVEGVLVSKTKVDNIVQPVPVLDHHLQDILTLLQINGQRLLDMEGAMENLTDATPFHKDFSGCTPYPHYYMPGWRCDYADLCRAPDWKPFTGMFNVREEHDFLRSTDLTVLGGAE